MHQSVSSELCEPHVLLKHYAEEVLGGDPSTWSEKIAEMTKLRIGPKPKREGPAKKHKSKADREAELAEEQEAWKATVDRIWTDSPVRSRDIETFFSRLLRETRPDRLKPDLAQKLLVLVFYYRYSSSIFLQHMKTAGWVNNPSTFLKKRVESLARVRKNALEKATKKWAKMRKEGARPRPRKPKKHKAA